MDRNPAPKKAQLLSLFNVNLYQPQLNSTSTQFQRNFNSTSSHPQPQINLSININLKSTSTQYGCDIKATQSCNHLFLVYLPQTIIILLANESLPQTHSDYYQDV